MENENPNGKYLGETRVRRWDLEAVVVEFEYTKTVTVLEHQTEYGKYGRSNIEHVRTRYTQNFGSKTGFDEIQRVINEEVKTGDLDDLIFRLRELKAKELRE